MSPKGTRYHPPPFPDEMNGMMSFYRNFSPSTPPVNYTGTPYRAVLVPTSGAPTFNWSNSTWPFPSGTKYLTQRFLTTSDPSLDDMGFTGFNAFTESVVGTTLTSGTNYRLWIQVHPSGYVSEVDEGDNVFPTNIRVQRL